MSTIDEDVYDHGYADGFDNGIKIGTVIGIKIGTVIGIMIAIDAIADIIMAVRMPGDSVEQSMSRIPVPEKFRSEVEAEVRKRIS